MRLCYCAVPSIRARSEFVKRLDSENIEHVVFRLEDGVDLAGHDVNDATLFAYNARTIGRRFADLGLHGDEEGAVLKVAQERGVEFGHALLEQRSLFLDQPLAVLLLLLHERLGLGECVELAQRRVAHVREGVESLLGLLGRIGEPGEARRDEEMGASALSDAHKELTFA